MVVAQITYWMMVLTMSMMMNGQSVQVGQVTIKNFANQQDCLAHMATITNTKFDQTTHSVTALCQVQTGP